MEDYSPVPGPGRPSAHSSMKKWGTVVFAVARAAGTFLLPSPITNLFDIESHQVSGHHHGATETAYLAGVRGLAATIVFIEHFGLPFYPGIVGEDGSEWSFLQLPIIRLFYHGSFAVRVFFVMSGFVLSRKLILLERRAIGRDGTGTETPDRAVLADQIRDVLTSATFRRAPRLFLPSGVIVLLMAGLAFFLDIFAAAAHFPGLRRDLYRLDVPRRLPTLGAQLTDCFDFILSQLIYPFMWMLDIPRQNDSVRRSQTYGFHLWTIPVEFWASQMLFLVLLATSLRRSSVRPVVIVLASSYSVWCGRWEPPLFLAGAQLADLDLSRRIAENGCSNGLPCSSPGRFYTFIYLQRSRACFGIVICIAGLWIGSMPDYNASNTFGFSFLAKLCKVTNSQAYWQGTGAILFVWSLQYCRWLTHFFEVGMLQYLGQISFALYLVHVPIVTSVGWATARFLVDIFGKNTNAPGWDRDALIAIGGLITFILATWVADIFWRTFDAPTISMLQRLDTHTKLE